MAHGLYGTQNAKNNQPATGPAHAQPPLGRANARDGLEFPLPGASYNFAKVDVRRDADGRVAAREVNDGRSTEETHYTYDQAGRLASAYKAGAFVERYAYGPRGERLTALDRATGQDVEYRYNDLLQLLRAGDTRFEYDDQGRLAARIQDGAATRYAYSGKGHLTGVLLPDGRRIGYQLDPTGARVAKLVNNVAVETYKWLERARLGMVADGRGEHTRAVVYDEESGMPRVLRTAGMDYVLAHDQVGTVFKVATPGGREVNRLCYDSFGKPLHQTNPDFPLPIGFAGGLYDADTGLYHFGFRDYDPTLGRFIQPDPIGCQGGDVDLYGYCLDDPVNLVDPLGLWVEGVPFQEYAPDVAFDDKGNAVVPDRSIQVVDPETQEALKEIVGDVATEIVGEGVGLGISAVTENPYAGGAAALGTKALINNMRDRPTSIVGVDLINPPELNKGEKY